MIKKAILVLSILFHCIVFSQSDAIHLISWNIRDFGQTKSNVELEAMAELLRDADIVAIQEVVAGYGGAQAVAKLADILNRKGANWDYVISDPTKSPKYVTERYAFIWKTRHLKIKNRGRLLKELQTEIDREPFVLDFYRKGEKFTLINFHSRPYTKNPEGEIIALTEYITSTYTTPLILAGDFNVAESKPVFDDFKAKKYAAAVSNEKTTLKRSCDGLEYRNHPIDNIFYSNAIRKTESGIIDFVQTCENLDNARKLSDHLPVYLRFGF